MTQRNIARWVTIKKRSPARKPCRDFQTVTKGVAAYGAEADADRIRLISEQSLAQRALMSAEKPKKQAVSGAQVVMRWLRLGMKTLHRAMRLLGSESMRQIDPRFPAEGFHGAMLAVLQTRAGSQFVRTGQRS